MQGVGSEPMIHLESGDNSLYSAPDDPKEYGPLGWMYLTGREGHIHNMIQSPPRLRQGSHLQTFSRQGISHPTLPLHSPEAASPRCHIPRHFATYGTVRHTMNRILSPVSPLLA